jgi:hypothetical protein
MQLCVAKGGGVSWHAAREDVKIAGGTLRDTVDRTS